MTTNQTDKRTTLIVDPAVQRRLMWDVIKVPTIALAVGTVMVIASFWIILKEAKSAGVELPGIYIVIVSLMGLVFISSCYVTRYTAIRLTNRIAGPLNRLKTAMEQVQRGDTSCRLTFRKEDYGADIAESFNQLLAYLETRSGTSSSGAASTGQAEEETVREYAGKE